MGVLVYGITTELVTLIAVDAGHGHQMFGRVIVSIARCLHQHSETVGVGVIDISPILNQCFSDGFRIGVLFLLLVELHFDLNELATWQDLAGLCVTSRGCSFHLSAYSQSLLRAVLGTEERLLQHLCKTGHALLLSSPRAPHIFQF